LEKGGRGSRQGTRRQKTQGTGGSLGERGGNRPQGVWLSPYKEERAAARGKGKREKAPERGGTRKNVKVSTIDRKERPS